MNQPDKQNFEDELKALLEGISAPSSDEIPPAPESEKVPLIFPQPVQHVKKKKSKLQKALLILSTVLLSFVILLGCTFSVFYYSGSLQMFGGYDDVIIQPPTIAQVDDVDDDGKTITYKGERYTFNDDVTSILCIGVDKEELGTESGVIGTAGQADAIYLLTIDNQNKRYNVISISRDTITDIETYSASGKFMGTEQTQLCLSYAYGDGFALSAENTVTAVSRLLYNVPINTYFAMDMDAISVLNDLVGGVTVPEYDENGNPTGKNITLHGDAAQTYVRRRNLAQIDSNNARMQRQINYLKAFSTKCIEATKADLNVPLDIFNAAAEYCSTSLTASKITYITTNVFSNNKDIDLSFLSVPGEVVKGEDGFAEFYADETQLLELVLDVFYIKQPSQ